MKSALALLVLASAVHAGDVLLIAGGPCTSTTDANGHPLPQYSPARPPALPLAVRSPYTNAWSSTANCGTLNSNGATFWTGDPVGWEGIVTVDGISYEYLGTGSKNLPSLPNLQSAAPLSVTYDSQYSNFTFAAGPVHIEASFFSPVIPKDLCRTSIPLSYLTTSVASTDSASHSVQFYSDINAAWMTYESNTTVEWDLFAGSQNATRSQSFTTPSSSVYSWLLRLRTQYEFGELYQFPEWGNFIYSSRQGSALNFSFGSGFSSDLRFKYVMQQTLSDEFDGAFRGSGSREPAFAYAHDLGLVRSGSVTYTIGSVQEPVIKYLATGGVLPLRPWWEKCYGDMFQMIDFHFNDLNKSAALGAAFESQLRSDIDAYYSGGEQSIVHSKSTTSSAPPPSSNMNMSMIPYASGVDQFGQKFIFESGTAYGFLDPENYGGIANPGVSEADSYYSIVALATRQIMGAYVLAAPGENPSSSGKDTSEPLLFQKEISSNGNTNTVDVIFPAMPFFLYANPDLLKYVLEPLYQNQESGFYPNGYAIHDLGSHFPNATGHVEGDDEYMPVEECGDMILMSYAYYKFSGDSSYLRRHYKLLSQWAQYLIDFALVPEKQLSTDDFAGELVNQTNLAIKGIVALGAMAETAHLLSAPSTASVYASTASSYLNQWLYLAIDPSENHAVLAYQWRSSWGLLYNLYPDKLLDLNVIPQAVYDIQSDWYPHVSQIFGVPLDNRHSYTKSDWELWTAATCSPSTRRLFVNAVALWLNETTTGQPFTDLYETIDHGAYVVSPEPLSIFARPVQGGLFSLLALGQRSGDRLISQ